MAILLDRMGMHVGHEMENSGNESTENRAKDETQLEQTIVHNNNMLEWFNQNIQGPNF